MKTAEKQDQPLFTFAEAARRLRISLRQFRRLVDSGRIAVVRLSARCVRVSPEELERFLKSVTGRLPEEEAS